MNVHSLFAYCLYEKWCAFYTQLVGLGVWGRFTPTKFVSSVQNCALYARQTRVDASQSQFLHSKKMLG